MLDPLERFSEIVFGLIMVLTFTCAMSVTDSAREDVQAMLIGALGCNLAWGIIDAAFYLIACLTARGRSALLLRSVHEAPSDAEAHRVITDSLPPKIAETLRTPELDHILTKLKQLPTTARVRFTAEDWRGALGVFFLVFLSTFPVTLPFLLLRDLSLALRVSNLIAILLLFASGHMLARYAGLNRPLTAFSMVAIGLTLVALAIALGG